MLPHLKELNLENLTAEDLMQVLDPHSDKKEQQKRWIDTRKEIQKKTRNFETEEEKSILI